jgi:predicted nucleic acid binding AN1-type Zn finger protein
MLNTQISEINNNDNINETNNETNNETTDKNIKEKKKKKRNKFLCDNKEEDCKQKKSQSIGFCKWCQKTFCSSHRLPETHDCIGLKNCKTQAFNINKNKINNEKCVMHKVALV